MTATYAADPAKNLVPALLRSMGIVGGYFCDAERTSDTSVSFVIFKWYTERSKQEIARFTGTDYIDIAMQIEDRIRVTE